MYLVSRFAEHQMNIEEEQYNEEDDDREEEVINNLQSVRIESIKKKYNLYFLFSIAFNGIFSWYSTFSFK